MKIATQLLSLVILVLSQSVFAVDPADPCANYDYSALETSHPVYVKINALIGDDGAAGEVRVAGVLNKVKQYRDRAGGCQFFDKDKCYDDAGNFIGTTAFCRDIDAEVQKCTEAAPPADSGGCTGNCSGNNGPIQVTVDISDKVLKKLRRDRPPRDELDEDECYGADEDDEDYDSGCDRRRGNRGARKLRMRGFMDGMKFAQLLAALGLNSAGQGGMMGVRPMIGIPNPYAQVPNYQQYFNGGGPGPNFGNQQNCIWGGCGNTRPMPGPMVLPYPGDNGVLPVPGGIGRDGSVLPGMPPQTISPSIGNNAPNIIPR